MFRGFYWGCQAAKPYIEEATQDHLVPFRGHFRGHCSGFLVLGLGFRVEGYRTIGKAC